MIDMAPQVVLDFWFKETPAESWFNGGTVFDQTIITKFGALHPQVALAFPRSHNQLNLIAWQV